MTPLPKRDKNGCCIVLYQLGTLHAKAMCRSFVANFTHFPTVKKFENRLTYDKVTESLKVGTFVRHSV